MSTPAEINAILKAKFADAVLEFKEDAKDPFITVNAGSIADICRFLRESPELSFDALMCLSGLDAGSSFITVYHLYSFPKKHKIVIKTSTGREAPSIPSVSDIWPVAGWHEREAFDLLGINFEGHGDLRRLLLPEDWVGHPLRKDYAEPETYNGLPTKR